MDDDKSPALAPYSHDAVYKKFFSDPVMVESLLRDFISEELALSFDFSTLEHVPSSYVSDDFRERHSDSIWRIQVRGDGNRDMTARWCYLYLLIEFQSSCDPFIAVRILSYTALLWQDLTRQKNFTTKDRLPPVLPIVIYNGKGAWTAKQLRELLPQSLGLLETFQARQEYFLLDERVYCADSKQDRHGLTALLLRLEKAKTQEDVQVLSKLLAHELRRPEFAHMRVLFSELIYMALRSAHSPYTHEHSEILKNDIGEVYDMLAENIAHIAQQSRMEGVKLGRVEGHAQGMHSMLLKFASLQWGSADTALIEKLQHITSTEHLEDLASALASMDTWQDFEHAVDHILRDNMS